MRIVDVLLNPAFFSIVALFLAVIWMLRDQKDRTRAELVLALVLNLFYGVLLNIFMGSEGSAFPWKFDHVLFRIDTALGIPAAGIARHLQGPLRVPLWLVYQMMVPMMIAWFLLTRYRRVPGIILAYIAELVSGPVLYTIVPACGPIYAFGKQWLSPPLVAPGAIRLAGIPNAFPSLHIGTAFVFLMFAPGRLWKLVALVFLIATGLATIATGEHYLIDLIPGLAFGVFVSSVGLGRYRRAAWFFALTLAWSLGVRFAYAPLIAHPLALRSFALVTLAAVAFVLWRQWSAPLPAAAEPHPIAESRDLSPASAG
jgi:PAP2 superfamily